MSRLIVCSEVDLPSVNMREYLLQKRQWENLGSFNNVQYLRCGDDVMMSIPDMHIMHEHLDQEAEQFGIKVDSIVVMSKHSAKSGRPALTVHPIGNYHEAEFGGLEQTLVKSNPLRMTDALRRIRSKCQDPEIQVCFEVTHHGPYVDKPTFYIEIGSEESHWGDRTSAELLADVIMENQPSQDDRILVGIGGGHYAPRFTEACLSNKVAFGHMIPNYQLEGRDDEDIARMVKDACQATGTDSVYIHRKSMKGPEEHRMADIVRSCGYETVSSKVFEPLQ